MKPKREKAEQRARRIGREARLGFYLWKQGGVMMLHHRAGRLLIDKDIHKLWRALERSQRALARERGKRP